MFAPFTGIFFTLAVNRIYLTFSTDQFKQQDKARFLLSYLKIRSTSKNSCGHFSLEKFISSTGLKSRTAIIHISALVDRGFIVKVSDNRYHVVAQRKLFSGGSRNLYFSVSDQQISEFSFKNISFFRAFLVELECERYKRHQRAMTKGYTITNQRDKSRDNVKNPKLRQWDLLMANACTGALMKIGTSTASKYRTRQNLSTYHFQVDVWTMTKPEKKRSYEGKMVTSKDYKGEIFESKGSLLHFPISKRVFNLSLKRG